MTPRLAEPDDDPDFDPDKCAVCGRPAATNYGDRDDMPSCGRPACELRMQAFLDYDEEVGNR